MTPITIAPNRSRPNAGDQAAVAFIPRHLAATWQARDADAFADVFTETGTLILPGVFCKGRRAIGSFIAAAFAGPYYGTRLTARPISIEFFGAQAALLITEGGIVRPGETEAADDWAVRASWTVVKHDSGWSLASYQNSPRDSAAAAA